VLGSSLSIRIEEMDKSQVAGKCSSGFHCMSIASKSSTLTHHGPVIGTEQDAFSQNQLNFPNKMSSKLLYSIAEN